MAGEDKKPGSYGKRPLWQWIVLYVIIGAVVYYGIYYVYTHRSGGGSGYGSNATTQQHSPY